MEPVAKATDDIKPVLGKIRIQILDVIRGFSILGILAVNADGFAAPQAASLNPPMWIFANEGWSAISYWIMDTFFHEKFLTLFSMLFGVSLFLVGGERADKHKSRILKRRLGILFIFGILHGFGIWWGDILSLYAATGALMYFFRSWTPKTLLCRGVIFYTVMVCLQIPAAVLSFGPPQTTGAVKENFVPKTTMQIKRKIEIVEAMELAKKSWTAAYQLNAQEYMKLLVGDLRLVPQTLALMMIGLSLYKSGFLAGRSSTRCYVAIMLFGVLALTMTGWLSWQTDILEKTILGERGFMLLLSPVVAVAYVASFTLFVKTTGSKLMSPVAATGRMAFTNYITQSLLMTSIFYGGRGAMMGEVDRPELWAITVAIWALQLAWSTLWLSRFEMGPFEWIWRCLTLGRYVSLIKAI